MSKHRKPRHVSPKVSTATGGSALGIVVAYYLDKIEFIHSAPTAVQGAIATLVIGAITFVAGYLKTDDARI